MSTLEKLLFVVLFMLALVVMTTITLALDWDSIPVAHREIIISAASVFVPFFIAASAAIFMWALHKIYDREYDSRMENQFNVGGVVPPEIFFRGIK